MAKTAGEFSRVVVNDRHMSLETMFIGQYFLTDRALVGFSDRNVFHAGRVDSVRLVFFQGFADIFRPVD